MRVLFTSTQGLGHFTPLLPFVEACRGRGDEVLAVVPPALVPAVETAGVPFRVGADPPAAELGAVWARVPTASPEEAESLVVGEIFGRLDTAAMLPAVRGACEEWGPDLILREPAEFASAVAADALGLPRARVGISLADTEEDSLRVAGPVLDTLYPGTADRIRASPYLTLFPAALDPSPFDRTRRLRDPALDAPARPLPDWWAEDEAPLVYVTFGSATGGMPIAASAYRTALDAVDGLRARVLLTVGRSADPDALGPVPDGVHVERWVPQADVVRQAAAVVCHGGSGTTLGALGAGAPLVVVPLFADQPQNARRVAEAGAGIAVEPDPGAPRSPLRFLDAGDAAAIRAAIETVLAEPSYRAAAGRIAAEMRTAPTVDAGLDEVQPPTSRA